MRIFCSGILSKGSLIFWFLSNIDFDAYLIYIWLYK